MHQIVFLLLMSLILLTGCQTAYYNAMEKIGYPKRDIMVQRVQDARDAQQETKEQFALALDTFSKTLNFEGGDLEEKYAVLKAALDTSEEKAQEVADKIQSVESVSEALFEEWREELGQYSNPSLRDASTRQFKRTQQQYRQLITAMKRAEKKIDPVLSAFRDQVLFLKHNLNAQAIASLQSELVRIENDVAGLIREMEKSIEEANLFIENMQLQTSECGRCRALSPIARVHAQPLFDRQGEIRFYFSQLVSEKTQESTNH